MRGSAMLIDFHTHAFPDRLAERAVASLSADIASPPLTDGTVSGLLAAMIILSTIAGILSSL